MDSRKNASTAIAEQFGERLKRTRLNRDMTQSEVAERAGVSRLAVLNAEKGDVRLKVLVAILSALDLAGQLDLFLPSQDVSPMQLARLKGRMRQRASGQRKTGTAEPAQAPRSPASRESETGKKTWAEWESRRNAASDHRSQI